MAEATDAGMKKFMSPEYRKNCIEWALQTPHAKGGAESVIEAAKKYYAYVYEGGVGK